MHDQTEQPTPSDFTPRVDLSELTRTVDAIRQAIGSVIVGQQKMVDLLITALLVDAHVLIEGVPGVAKTLAAKLLARTLDVEYARIQFTPDLMPSDILGTLVFNQKSGEFEYREGPIFASIVLIDEVNRAPAKTQAALFEVMEERQVTVEGESRPMTAPFIVLATQNPIEQEGTYRLPEAQLDRFLFKIDVGYPTEEEEGRIIRELHESGGRVDAGTIAPVVDAATLGRLVDTVRSIRVEEDLIAYVAAIVARTRNSPDLLLGASPRASLAIVSAAKGSAAMAGRDFVTPDDIRTVIPPVLRHRIILTPEREMQGSSPDDLVTAIVESVETPR